jgi:GNAT superfamily N-acetyltransferase
VDRARPAIPSERPQVVATIAAAFSGDPAWAWLLGADFTRLAPVFAGALFDLRVGGGHVWTMGAAAESVALWEPPGGLRTSPSAHEAVWGDFSAAAGDDVRDRVERYDAALVQAVPPQPYWYLGVLATRPDRTGSGLATAVIAPVLGRADEDGEDCCLETSTQVNRDFYSRRGFSEATEVRITGGPPTWWLRRPASARDR